MCYRGFPLGSGEDHDGLDVVCGEGMKAAAPKCVDVEEAEETSRLSNESAPAGDHEERVRSRGMGEVMAGVAAGAPPAEDEGFAERIARYRPAMRDKARMLCRGHADADDVVQDAFVRALRTSRRPHDPRDETRVRAWLLAIVSSVFIDMVRRRKRLRTITHDLELPDVAAEEPTRPLPWEDISDEALRAAMERLSYEVRETYRMFANGLSYREIAAKLNILVATVGTRVHRARRQLRRLLAANVEKDR
jgi:RNA polymerase sigma-70 factor (ECF subfamily)